MEVWDYFSSETVIADMSALKSAVDTTKTNLANSKYVQYFATKFPDAYTKFIFPRKYDNFGIYCSVFAHL